MLEIAALLLTIGGMLYHTLGIALGTTIYIALLVAVSLSLLFRTREGVVAGVVCAGCMVLGSLNMWRADAPTDARIYGNRAFDAQIVSVDRRLDKTNIVVRDIDYGKKLQVSVRGKVQVLPGDMRTVRGSVQRPEDFVTDTGRLFGYEAYLASKGIVGVVREGMLGPTTDTHFSISRIPTIIRYSFADVFARYIVFPFDGVMAGMTVGYQGGLPDYIADLFRNTGVLHVLVLSGYNITLLAGAIGILLRNLPFRLRNLLTILAILMLVLVSGAGVAAVRAGIMGSIAIFAGLSIRSYQPFRALIISYLFFFFLSPTSVFVDPGFHLSFLATLFMILVLPKVETLFQWLPQTRGIDVRELLMLAVSAPLFMLPYMMYFSGNFPLASPIANILFALITPVIMMSGIFLYALSWIGPVATLLGTLVSWCGSIVLKLLEYFSHIYIWQTPPLSWWGVALIYCSILYVLFHNDIISYLLQLGTRLRPGTS